MLLITQDGNQAINMEKVIRLRARPADYDDFDSGTILEAFFLPDECVTVGYFSMFPQAQFEAAKIIDAWSNGAKKLEVAEDAKSDCRRKIAVDDEEDDCDDGCTENTDNPESPDLLLKGINWLDLSTRAYNALNRYGIKTIADLVGKTERQLGRIRNIGEASAREIAAALRLNGLSLKEDEDGD